MTRAYPAKFCVYAHLLDGERVYIGAGHSGRAFDFKDRTPEHRLAAIAGIDVEYLAWFDTLSEAYKAETKLLDTGLPRFNKVRCGFGKAA